MAHGFEEYYRTGDAPWDIGKPDFNLIQIVTTTSIKPCRALEIGCGTGDNAIWLAQQKFEVLAFDTSEGAIEKAKEKAQQAGVQCSFRVVDILKSDLQEAPFGFAFDRGCFHTLDSGKDRKLFAQRVHRHLGGSGLWLSLIGNADEKRLGPGPPQRTARHIVNAVESYFEILSLVSGHFGSDRPDPPRAWLCLMRNRAKITDSSGFLFPIPKGSQTQVKATFWYYYSPLAKTESQKRVTFLTLNRLAQ